MRVFEHSEACPAPCGGGTVIRSMRRVATVSRGLRENRDLEDMHRFYRFRTPLRGRTHRFYRVAPFLSTKSYTEI